MNILIIEDDPTLRDVLREFVAQRKPERIHTAAALSMARAVLEHEEIDAVLCDGRFPSHHGATALHAQRENWPYVAGLCEKKRIRFAVLSGSEETVTRAKVSGYAAFRKPLETRHAIDWLFYHQGTERAA